MVKEVANYPYISVVTMTLLKFFFAPLFLSDMCEELALYQSGEPLTGTGKPVAVGKPELVASPEDLSLANQPVQGSLSLDHKERVENLCDDDQARKAREVDNYLYISVVILKQLKLFFARLSLSISSAATEQSQTCARNWQSFSGYGRLLAGP